MGEPVRKKRRVSPDVNGNANGNGAATATDAAAFSRTALASSFAAHASTWDLEQDYERRPRVAAREKAKVKAGMRARLPIKLADGRLEAVEDDSPEEDDEADPASDDQRPPAPAPNLNLPLKQQILLAKEDLARVAGSISESPEEHIGQLRRLQEITSSPVAAIVKLGLATQLAVYKDVIPGYRIRPLTEQDMKSASKDVKKVQNFEQSILRGYYAYVLELARVASLDRDPTKSNASLSTVAVSCACQMLLAAPHFNHRSELLKILVDRMSKKRNADFDLAYNATEKLLADDDEGNVSLEAVQTIARMIKARHYQVDGRVFDTFLSLRLLDEFAYKASTDRIDRDDKPAPKKQREFRTKRERKVLRERKGIEKEMAVADAVATHEHRDALQAETLKLVFGVYFRTLQAKVAGLHGVVLEGLARFAHLINQDFFGDLLEVLREMMRDALAADYDEPPTAAQTHDRLRRALLCITTAFALLQGQDASKSANSLGLDLGEFVDGLYAVMYDAALDGNLETLAAPVTQADGASAHRVNAQTTIVLLLRALQAVLLSPARTPTHASPARLRAFAKRILTLSLAAGEKSARALLGVVVQAAAQPAHARALAGLWDSEARAEGARGGALLAALAGAAPGAAVPAPAFERELLARHFSPRVREAVDAVDGAVAAGAR